MGAEGDKMIKAKYKIGDKVDFINDYGVIFKGKEIIKVDTASKTAIEYEEPLYYIKPTDAHWMYKRENNLRYSKPNFLKRRFKNV